MPVLVSLPDRLLVVGTLPADPPWRCTDPTTKKATVCHDDLLQYTQDLLMVAKQALGQIKEIGALQP